MAVFELSKKVLITVSAKTLQLELLEEPMEILRLNFIESRNVSLDLALEIFSENYDYQSRQSS